jgi:hypothetical protein
MDRLFVDTTARTRDGHSAVVSRSPSPGRGVLPGLNGDGHAVLARRLAFPFAARTRPAEPVPGRAKLHMLQHQILDPYRDPRRPDTGQLDTAADGQVDTLL